MASIGTWIPWRNAHKPHFLSLGTSTIFWRRAKCRLFKTRIVLVLENCVLFDQHHHNFPRQDVEGWFTKYLWPGHLHAIFIRLVTEWHPPWLWWKHSFPMARTFQHLAGFFAQIYTSHQTDSKPLQTDDRCAIAMEHQHSFKVTIISAFLHALFEQKCIKKLQGDQRTMTQWGPCALCHVSEVQGMPFWHATQLHPQKDWTGWQNGVTAIMYAHRPQNTSTEHLLRMLITCTGQQFTGLSRVFVSDREQSCISTQSSETNVPL